ncbi:MAG: excinuclease ABC subunit UvrC [Candidatus Altiarchaeota archaeon]
MEDGILATIANAPKMSGVYLWKEAGGRILYVGKAENLRERLRGYINPLDQKTARLVENAASVQTVVTQNAEEALILEDALVKQNQPRYNVRLKDDKRYPYIRVTVGEEYPRAEVVRRVEPDGSRYFGPYTDSLAVRRVVGMLGDFFGLRQCKNDLRRVERPCINHVMGRCSGPCKVIGRGEYSELVQFAIRFLGGDFKGLRKYLRAEIKELGKRLQFERARELRDILFAVESISHRQDVSSAKLEDMDVLGYGFLEGRANMAQLVVRGHRVVAILHHPLTGAYADSPGESMKAFIKQHYTAADLTPKRIVTSEEPADRGLLGEVLERMTGSKVSIMTAVRGRKRKLADMAVGNSILQIRQDMLKSRAKDPLELLMQIFRLGRPPQRIEGYDISNLGEKETAGGMVVFTGGRPDKGQYRRFRIRGMGQNDPENLAEMVRRRFRHDEWATPELVLLDGGRAQISAVVKHIPAGIPVLALAKRDEEVYLPGRREPVRLAKDSPALLLLQAVRDEVHRFGKRYHTLRRGKAFLKGW